MSRSGSPIAPPSDTRCGLGIPRHIVAPASARLDGFPGRVVRPQEARSGDPEARTRFDARRRPDRECIREEVHRLCRTALGQVGHAECLEGVGRGWPLLSDRDDQRRESDRRRGQRRGRGHHQWPLPGAPPRSARTTRTHPRIPAPPPRRPPGSPGATSAGHIAPVTRPGRRGEAGARRWSGSRSQRPRPPPPRPGHDPYPQASAPCTARPLLPDGSGPPFRRRSGPPARASTAEAPTGSLEPQGSTYTLV
jgi:hypothetical protein